MPFAAALAAFAPVSRAAPGDPGPAPKTAFALPVLDNWEISGGLPENALIISLQGLANTDAPQVYIDYPADWHFHDFSPVKQFYTTKYGVAFTQLDTPEAALRALGHFAKGYVVWDKKVRTSLNVAFTAAGIFRAVVVDADLIPLAEAQGLKPLADFRGLFEGMNDVQIYQWAYDRYWKDCSRDYLVWMGGAAGNVMEPGVADLAIAFHAFVADLTADPNSRTGRQGGIRASQAHSGPDEARLLHIRLAFLREGHGRAVGFADLELRLEGDRPEHAAQLARSSAR